MTRIQLWILVSLLGIISCKAEVVNPENGTENEEEVEQTVNISTDTVRVGLRLASYRDDLKADFTHADYQFCYDNVHFAYDRGGRNSFKTRVTFPEYYICWEEGEMDTNPATNPLVQMLKAEEREGEIYGVNIAREAMVGCPEGPIPVDRRILFESDMVAIRKVINEAHEKGILKRNDYKIIQMLEESNVFCNNERAKEIVRMMDGVCLEVHHFNVHWPLDEGKIKRSEVVEGALWTLDQVNIHGDSLEYVFYYGPFIGKDCAEYTPNIFKAWLQKFWQAGLPKYNDRMIYHLNAFKHACGSSRPVAPESDPYSVMGCTKWLIEELNPWMKKSTQ
ncbi:hypothetical protein [uncultured Draconibacterium sp.]|uniref:hypothetical protein n=1 Tax=uncultured Draconibacterium sp. TaxID=1573823 RepID=UPI00326112D3